jgi:hypothetical protein
MQGLSWGWRSAETPGIRFARCAFHMGQHCPHSQHLHEILIEKTVEGPSHCGGIRAVIRMELSASNERLDFGFAQFDREAPHSLSSPLAVPTHALSAGESAHAGWQGSGEHRGIGIVSHCYALV